MDLSQKEIDRYTSQIEEIIKYFDSLDKIPALEKVEPVGSKKKFSDLRKDEASTFEADPLGSKYRKDGFVKGPRMV